MITKTSKVIYIILSVTLLLAVHNVNAQSGNSGELRFGVGVDGILPIGNTARGLNFGLGITPRLQYGVSEKFALTFTSGIYHFFPKTITYPASGSFSGFSYERKSDIIPVKAGFKYFIGKNFYLAGEAGLGFEVADGGGPIYFLWSPGFGYASKRWDVGARFENYAGSGGSDGITALRVAYGFGL
ncbi:hypothetical protein ACFQZS_03365 [Mucilaginibacter calamicampi]|uniref:Outer membrane protein beta-barrel domain-containing protein n=1 Tax=Mucilaginibacter calamicampi TaxID=1302352 RepID=A0ABW2YX89_9SPHI